MAFNARSAFRSRTSVLRTTMAIMLVVAMAIPPSAPALEDTTPPTTNDNAPAGDVPSALVTLSAMDDMSGVAATYYRLDRAAWAVYTAPIAVSLPGTHTLEYYSQDVAGNTEATKFTWFVVTGQPQGDPVKSVPGNSTTAKPIVVLIAGLKSDTGHHAIPYFDNNFSAGWHFNDPDRKGDPWGFLGLLGKPGGFSWHFWRSFRFGINWDAATTALGAADVIVMPTAPGASTWPAEARGAGVLDSTGSLSYNMKTLANWLNSYEFESKSAGHPVVLVGHSYGGVIARSMLASDKLPRDSDIRKRIVGVVQFGSPNGGSAAADWANSAPGNKIAELGIAGIARCDATKDLARTSMDRWNRDFSGEVGVPVVRFGGTYLPGALDVVDDQAVNLQLVTLNQIMQRLPSDGLVAAESLQFGHGSLWDPAYDFGDGDYYNDEYLGHAGDLPAIGKSYNIGWKWWGPPTYVSYEEVVPQSSSAWFFGLFAAKVKRLARDHTGLAAQSTGKPRALASAASQPVGTDAIGVIPRAVAVTADQTSTVTLSLDTSATIVLHSDEGTPSAVVSGPGDSSPIRKSFALPQTQGFATVFQLSPTQAGEHTLGIRLPVGVSGAVSVSGLFSGGARLRLSSAGIPFAGNPAVVTARYTSEAGTPLTGGPIIGTATLEGETAIPVSYRDDGVTPDEVADDGTYAAGFTPAAAGKWVVEVAASHPNAERQGGLVVDVGSPLATITGSAAVVTPDGPNGTFASFGIEVPLTVSESGTYTVTAPLADASGALVGHLTGSRRLTAGDPSSVAAILPALEFGGIPTGPLKVGDLIITKYRGAEEIRVGSGAGFTTQTDYSASDFYAFAVTLSAPAANPSATSTVEFSGTARNTSSTVSDVDYSIDGGVTWSAATPADGSFDESSEEYTITRTLPDCAYGIVVRQTGADGTVLPVEDWAGTRFIVDTKAPDPVAALKAVSLDASGTRGAELDWEATELPSDSVAQVRYEVRVDGTLAGMTLETETTVTVPASGPHTATVAAVDEAGNRAAPRQVVFHVDANPPVTMLRGMPSNWTSRAVEFGFTSADATGGVLATRYALGDGPEQDYESSVTVMAEGSTRLAYRSIDRLGNAEATRTAYIRIDKTAPVTTASIMGPYSGRANISLKATDSALSGVSRTEWSLNGTSWTAGTSAVLPAPGTYSLRYRSLDIAGNREETRASTVTVGAYGVRITKSPTGSLYSLRRRNGVAYWTFGATFKTHTGSVIKSKRVYLQRSTNGTSWRTVYTLTTSSYGKASKRLAFRTRGTTYWRWHSPATTTYSAAASSRTKIAVR